ncbi:formate dehydrogenase accessory protein FdhE [candidate division KSB1 bacterium]|nr:formate dehydrogenase accessory protein FdhE [candidate division KSB1 bacterium]
MTDILKEKHQLFVTFMSFHEELLKTQVKTMQHLIAIIPFQKLNGINAAEKLNHGESLISSQNFLLEDKDVEHVFDQLLPVIKKYHPSDDLNRLEDLYDKRRINLRTLAIATVQHDVHTFKNLGEKYDLPDHFLEKVSELLASPYLELCSEFFMKAIAANKWNRHTCPVCGNHPRMGSTNDLQNRRLLWCHVCSTEWEFELTTCPFCLNDDPKSIKYIFPPDHSAHRIDACDNCNHYIKIIDAAMTSTQSNFTIDYLSTFPLDVIAIQNGYHL